MSAGHRDAQRNTTTMQEPDIRCTRCGAQLCRADLRVCSACSFIVKQMMAARQHTHHEESQLYAAEREGGVAHRGLARGIMAVERATKDDVGDACSRSAEESAVDACRRRRHVHSGGAQALPPPRTSSAEGEDSHACVAAAKHKLQRRGRQRVACVKTPRLQQRCRSALHACGLAVADVQNPWPKTPGSWGRGTGLPSRAAASSCVAAMGGVSPPHSQ